MSREIKIKIFINIIFLIFIILLTALLFSVDYSSVNIAQIIQAIIVYFGAWTIILISIKDLIVDIKRWKKK